MKKSEFEKRIDDFIDYGNECRNNDISSKNSSDLSSVSECNDDLVNDENIYKALEEKVALRIDGFIGSNADKAHEYLEKAWENFFAGYYENVQQNIDMALLLFVKGGSVDALGIATAFYCAARALIMQKRFEEAIKLLNDSEIWYNKSTIKPELDNNKYIQNYRIFNKRAYAYNRMKSYDLSVNDMREALIYLIKAKGINNSLTAEYYCDYGEYLYDAGRHNDAYEATAQSLKIYNHLIRIYRYKIIIGSIGRSANQLNETETYIIDSQNRKITKILFECLKLAYDLMNLICNELELYSKSIHFTEEFRTHLIGCGFDTPVNIAAVEIELAYVFYQITDYKKAHDYYVGAINLLINDSPEVKRDIIIAESYKGIGDILIKERGNFAQCEMYYEQATKLYLNHLMVDFGRALVELIDICESYSYYLNNHEAALKLYGLIISTSKSFDNIDPFLIGKVFYNYGIESSEYGVLELAIDNFKQSIECFKLAGRMDMAEKAERHMLKL